MNRIEEVLEYLNTQFPSTKGHIPLREKLEEIYNQGYQVGYDKGYQDEIENSKTI